MGIASPVQPPVDPLPPWQQACGPPAATATGSTHAQHLRCFSNSSSNSLARSSVMARSRLRPCERSSCRKQSRLSRRPGRVQPGSTGRQLVLGEGGAAHHVGRLRLRHGRAAGALQARRPGPALPTTRAQRRSVQRRLAAPRGGTWQKMRIPVGLWKRSTAVSTLFTFWPPAPPARAVVSSMSCSWGGGSGRMGRGWGGCGGRADYG